MKKSIGIIAAVVLSASIYSQNYDPAKPHQSSNSATAQSDSSSQSYSSGSASRSYESSPGSAEFDAQSSLRANSDDTTTSTSTGTAKQGLSLTDEEAAQILRNSDDPERASRNQRDSLNDPDRSLSQNSDDSEPDMIYEEWILITPEDVGAPSESETGTTSSKDTDVPANPDLEMDDDGEFSSQFDRETGVLNDERIYNGDEYSQDYVGGPAESQSGTVRNSKSADDDCEVEHLRRSVESSGAALDHDERLNLERESVGGPGEAQSQSESSDSWDDNATVRSSGSAVDHDERYRINRSQSDDRNQKKGYYSSASHTT
jgi:hypothetical protein